MQPGEYNFTIYQGATFSKVITWQGVNLTGYTAAMQIRDEHGDLILDVGALDDGLVIDGSAGTVTITIPASSTAELTFDTANYDLFLSSTTRSKLLKGVVTLETAVTEFS